MNTEGGNAYPTHRPSDTSTLMGNNKQLPDPDSVKGRTLLAMDAKKLSDPALLARLTGHYGGQRKDSEGNNLPNGCLDL
uniref:Uncharacterized protein n=1 Tax=Ditylenchus dipsaci TaxID=166011 RepID=A0A915EHS9_9BILA